MQIFDFPQGSPEWFEARKGIPTASEFECIVKRLKNGSYSKDRETYMLKLAAEILTDELMEVVTSKNMDRGKAWEPEARDGYSFITGEATYQVGFVRNKIAGCSPDGLVGDNKGVEIKSAANHIQVDRLLKNALPDEFKAQVQGSLWITEREVWDFTSYCPKLPQMVVPVYREDGYIANLAGEISKFNDELAAMVEKIRRYGEPVPTVKDQLIASAQASDIPRDYMMAG